MKGLRVLVVALAILLVLPALASAQTWTQLTNQPSFETDSALQLTDGTVMVHQYNSGNWWRLTPDTTGSYINGTWTQLASMPSGYAPLYFAAAVFADGNVLIEGGEYNNLSQDETNKGAFYNTAANTWTNVAPPTGWTEIGDSPAQILATGQFYIGQNESTKSALFNETAMTWITTGVGTGKADNYSEEGFALLPDNSILTVDTQDLLNSERFIPTTRTWMTAGSTLVELPDPGSEEIGPNVLQPASLTVLALGAKSSGSAHTAIYTPSTNTWVAGPNFPTGGMADAPAAVLPDGNVLVETCPGIFGSPVTFYEFNGSTFTVTVKPSNVGAQNTSYEGRFLDLPTGQVLFTVADGSTKEAAVYTPTGSANPAWAPVITGLQSQTLTPGSTYTIKGTQFNGLSSGASYGDDAQMNSNYPLVRITQGTNVVYCKTHNHTSMGVATGATIVGTRFDVPATSALVTGAATIEVVANGIASAPKNVHIN
jgi:hypothetical protein